MNISTDLRQTMQTRLTPEQIQVIKMIECPNIELEERIQKELIENPVLEIGEDEPEDRRSLDFPAKKIAHPKTAI